MSGLGHSLTGEVKQLDAGVWALNADADGYCFLSTDDDAANASQWVSDVLDKYVVRDGEGTLLIEEKWGPDSAWLRSAPLCEGMSVEKRLLCWECHSMGHQIKQPVYVLTAGHYHSSRMMWKVAGIHEACKLSAGALGYSTTWVHKRLPTMDKKLKKSGLPVVVRSIPYAGAARGAEAVPLEAPALCTQVPLLFYVTRNQVSEHARQHTLS